MTLDSASVDAAAAVVRDRLGGRAPVIALVLGSGLGFLADCLTSPIRIRYRDIPGFAVATVKGHGGELVFGTLAGRDILIQSGRFHLYEGHSPRMVALPVRVFASIGIRTLILTNAAGGIRRTFGPGTLMAIADHVNLTFRNPLCGPLFAGEERFPDMSDPYDALLRRRVLGVAARCGISLEEGIYAGLPGPSYETPAEIRMLDRLGVDAVGMSTVTETIVARALGMRCLGISTITNAAAGLSPTRLSHDDVLRAAGAAGGALETLIRGVVEEM